MPHISRTQPLTEYDRVPLTTRPMMIFHDATWRDASSCVCSRTRGRRSSSETPSSSRACWQDGHVGRAPAADPCCRSGSGTGRGRDVWLPREGAGCAENSTFYHKCYRQTGDAGMPAPPPTDIVRTTSTGNREVTLAIEQSVQNTQMHLMKRLKLKSN